MELRNSYFVNIEQRSSNYEVGIKPKVFQLRSRNKIFDFQITQFLPYSNNPPNLEIPLHRSDLKFRKFFCGRNVD